MVLAAFRTAFAALLASAFIAIFMDKFRDRFDVAGLGAVISLP